MPGGGGGGGGAPGAVTANPPVRVAVAPPGFVTVTSRGPTAAPAAMVNVAWSWVADGTVTPAHRHARAPRSASPRSGSSSRSPSPAAADPCPRAAGLTPVTVGTAGTVTLAAAAVSSVNVTVSVSIVPATNFPLNQSVAEHRRSSPRPRP